MATLKGKQPVSNSKRKLVKSSAVAMPAILTLRSGAAFALSSTEACIAKDQQLAERQQPKWAVENHTGPWVRIECAYIVIKEAEVSKITIEKGHKQVEKRILVDKNDSNPFVVVLTDKGWRNLDFVDSFGSHRFNKFVPRTKWFYFPNEGKRAEVVVMKSESGGQQRYFKIVEGNPYQGDNNSSVWVLAQVDEDGSVVGFGSSTQYNHITGSCWASVNPGLGDFA